MNGSHDPKHRELKFVFNPILPADRNRDEAAIHVVALIGNKKMGNRPTPALIAWFLAFACLGAVGSQVVSVGSAASSKWDQTEVRERCANREIGRLFFRTELFFGKAKADGSTVTDDEFHRFLNRLITPRFPDGLTALSGTGQFRGSSGMVMREGGVFVILLYPADDERSSARIEEIRKAYRRNFQQESVLRVDSQSCVSF
jgi:hypothetical protein